MIDINTLSEKEKWIIAELINKTPVFIENSDLMAAFSNRFYPENKKLGKLHSYHIVNMEQTIKNFQKCLRSLKKKNLISKKAMGVHGAKTQFLLGRNWIWAWRLSPEHFTNEELNPTL